MQHGEPFARRKDEKKLWGRQINFLHRLFRDSVCELRRDWLISLGAAYSQGKQWSYLLLFSFIHPLKR
jgi:hypothetical protein